jgi:hypothetical protein
MKTTRQDVTANPQKAPVSADSRWTAEDITQSVSRLQEQVIATAKDAYERIADNASRTLATMNNRSMQVVRKYPVQVAIGALAIGFLAGAALFRRNSIEVQS